MSLALFAMIQELKAEVTALTARVVVLEAKALHHIVIDSKAEPRVVMDLPSTVMGISEPRPTLSLSKPNKRA